MFIVVLATNAVIIFWWSDAIHTIIFTEIFVIIGQFILERKHFFPIYCDVFVASYFLSFHCISLLHTSYMALFILGFV